ETNAVATRSSSARSDQRRARSARGLSGVFLRSTSFISALGAGATSSGALSFSSCSLYRSRSRLAYLGAHFLASAAYPRLRFEGVGIGLGGPSLCVELKEPSGDRVLEGVIIDRPNAFSGAIRWRCDVTPPVGDKHFAIELLMKPSQREDIRFV